MYKTILLSFLFVGRLPAADLTLATFNIRIFSTGSRDDTELALIADRLELFDLVAVQELRDAEVVVEMRVASEPILGRHETDSRITGSDRGDVVGGRMWR